MAWAAILTGSVLLVLGMMLYGVGVYNNLVRLGRMIDQNFSNIDVILKQRRDELRMLIDIRGAKKSQPGNRGALHKEHRSCG